MISRAQATAIKGYLESTANKVIIIYGARQVGKTTLVSGILESLDKRILSIDGDQQQYVQVLSSRDLGLLGGLVQGYDILFIDEAQRIPDIGINLKLLHDHYKDLRIIVTVSSSLELASRVTEPLTGRSRIFHLHPISTIEWRDHDTLNNFEMGQALNSFLRYGLYPEPLTIQNSNEKIEQLIALRDGYLYRDILTMGRIEYPEKIPLLARMLAYQIGSEVSIQELATALRIHRETVEHYINLLEQNFIIRRIGGFSRNLRKEVTKMDKIYFVDVGMRNAILEDFSPIEIRGDKGALLENFFVMEMIKAAALRRYHASFYFWRLYSGAELDLIVHRDGQLNGFEVKWKKSRKKGPASWFNAYPDATYTSVRAADYFSAIDTFAGQDTPA